MTDILGRLTTSLADRYRIERELGQGGMATVYLAQDVRHQRKVALKVLRPELSAILGGDRFLQEIRTTANLQHPHILPLHDSGEVDGVIYYVMPYVEGESLRDRLRREHQMPVEDAVRVAREVADALEYAHQHGVVHRDIKPENILLQGEHALVADFGIALAASRSDGGSRMTETGMSLGTPHYMAPEQAMGEREITAKADIYALGCVLYEMLTAEPPFTGATAQAIVARVMTEQPRSLTLQRRTIPRNIEAAVQQALEKLPADRFASAAEFAAALSNRSFGYQAAADSRSSNIAHRPSLLQRLALPVTGVAVIAVAFAGWAMLKTEPPQPVMRFDVAIPDSHALRTAHNGISIALSPDGSKVVFVGRSERGGRVLLVRGLDQLEPVVLPGTEEAESPFFSPDGQWVGFFALSKLKKVALAGGPPLTIADASGGRGGAWGADDRIVFTPTSTSGLLRVSAAGGAVETLTEVRADSGETSHRFPEILPGGRMVAFTVQSGARYGIAVVELESRSIRTVIPEGMNARWSPTGHLLYGSETGALLAVPFDARRGTVTGSPVSLLEGMLVKVPSGSAEYTLSPTGTLVYLTGALARRALTMVDRHGNERVLSEHVALEAPRFSPDGRFIAMSSIEQRTPDIRVLDIQRGTISRLTFEGANRYPAWSPDGRRIAFTSTRPGSLAQDIYEAAADGSGEARVIAGGPGNQWEFEWARDGRHATLRQIGQTTGRDLHVMSVDSARTVRPYLVTPFDERSPAISPDGGWLAYVSNESGRDEVYVRAFPEPTGRWQVSGGGGVEPRWSRRGNELFYRNEDSLISASVSLSPTFSVGVRQALFARPLIYDNNHAYFDVHPDNQHFVMVRGGLERSGLVVALNWFEELRRRTEGSR